ncbi:helix-turn-helix domain-containing protein [Kriegella aquimaris]|uniref:AraC-type DNA-binding protein n=1 Tax=Kriegella aquimaris TaxID=192904 RepID=A0A1G9Q3Q8_9FLAO|nr:helix-turn-helix domain-containing protein [Kriegella aquimaris]SDM04965.1 AraC-type DNA-binding protein [Kriegella aquimaris]
MKTHPVNISRIVKKRTTKPKGSFYTVCWIQDEIKYIEIDKIIYENVSNAIFFLDPINEWTISIENTALSPGYIMYLSKEILNEPLLSKLHINEVRLFNSGEIPKINLSPGIAKRTQAILEMLDELIASSLNSKESAILSLLNTFFVYCDGQCNIKSIITSNNSKSNIVYKFKKLVDKNLSKFHQVNDYANLLNISSKYLNECVKEILHVSAKDIITEQLLMQSRHALKFSGRSIKEISFELGFSSPDYFNYFVKSHTGNTPSAIRKS